MKTLHNRDIEPVKAADLKPGMILPDGIVKHVEVSGKPANRNAFIYFFGGNTGFVGSEREVNVIAKVDDALLANMMGA
jgi:hypothetical protein